MTCPKHDTPTIAEARTLLANRQISVPELVDECLTRVSAYEPVSHAFVTLTADRARAAALASQKAIEAGQPLGLLHGIPIAFKDIFETKGIRTTGQSRLLEDNVPTEDATTVTRLAEAGAISLGKLTTYEFAIGGPSFDLPWPPATNPWNPAHDTGGSSSGTGAAVASGMILGGMGSDTGGSIRIPASHCGIAGLKPTYGRVSKAGVLPLCFSLDHVGPMAWTTEDCALMLQAIAGPDPRDPSTAPARVPDYMAALGQGVRGKRILVPRHFFEIDSPADADCAAAFEEALRVMADLGAEIREITLSPLGDYVALQSVISRSHSYTVHAETLKTRPEAYGKFSRERLTLGSLYTANDYINALRLQAELVAEMLAVVGPGDLMLTPTMPSSAPLLKGQSVHMLLERHFYTHPCSVTGFPALSVCNGFSSAGMPFGLQIAGRPFDEAGVLAAGHAYEQATGWRASRANPLASALATAPIEG